MLAGCASVSVGNVHPKGTPPASLPSKIYVREFAAPEDTFRVDRSGQDLDDFIKAERHAFAESLVQQLSKYIAPAEILPDGKPLPKGNVWLLEGTYVEVDQGSRVLRTAVGFGVGSTKMETHAIFSAQSVTKKGAESSTLSPFLSLLTTGGSGMAPGAIAGLNPAAPIFIAGAAANAGGASLSGVSVDRNRTAREITATLSEYCLENKLIPESKTRRPKLLGELPPIQKPDLITPKEAP